MSAQFKGLQILLDTNCSNLIMQNLCRQKSVTELS